MSRIDRALRIRESGTAALPAGPPAAHAGGAPAIEQYDREERLAVMREPRHVHEEPAPAVIEPATQAPRGVDVVTQRSRPAHPSVGAHERSRLVTGTSSSVSIEQYRKLAAVLHDEQVQGGLKSVMITSALPGEGKTLTAVNLALTLAESYERRVLLIDADLRAPSLHHTLHISNDRGLGDALRHGHELSFVEVSSGLTVLCAGNPGRNPLAGLTSKRMEEILQHCAGQFDWVLVDTPPVGVLPDAQVLARLTGAVLFVIGAGSTPAPAVERSIAELGGPDAILGLVLNRVDERRIPEAGYYGRYEAAPSR
jgi:capsular exopolysaccharide synthesis family protein